jgi:hypothetical protein
MSTNPLNDISRVYLKQVAVVESLDPVGKEDADVDNDGKKNTNSDKYLLKRRKAIGNAISTQEAKEVKRWWDDDGDGKGYEEGEVSGKFKKKKSVKEGYSNWRQDLAEVIKDVETDKKITEKKVNNKIEINPKLDLGEAVEGLGGILLEMVEIDEVDFIVESVYGELLGEGYEEDDIEDAIEYALTEAKVTFGHDTPTGQRKRGNLLRAVGRLARQKLSSRVRGAQSAATGAIASGARKVAKGALSVARKMEGDKKPSKVHSKPGVRTASTYSGAGTGQKERVSSGSYQAPAKPKPKAQSQKSPDPWGEPTKPAKATSKPQASPKPQAKTTTVTAKPLNKRQQQAAMRAVRRNPNISKSDLNRITSSIDEAHYSLATGKVESGKPGEAHKKAIETLAAKATTKKKTRNPVGKSRRGGSFKPSSPDEAKQLKQSWSDYWSSAAKGYKEQYEILEKAESEQQQKIFGLALSVKRGQTSRDKVSDKVLKIVDGMSEKKIRDFAKTPHKGLPHKVETKEEAIRQELIARMVEKIEEQSQEYIDEAKLPRAKKKSKKEEKLAGPKNPKHVVQLDLDQAALREVGSKRLKDSKTGKKKTTKVEPAKINVKGEGGNVVRTVSTGDFHKEKLGKGETMDFSPLRDPKKFKKTTVGNKSVLNKSRGATVEINTARGSFKESVGANREIKQHLSDIGYNRSRNIKLKAGHFTGDMPGSGSPGKKLIATKRDIEKYKPQKMSHIDDDPKNLEPLEKHRRTSQGSKGETRGSDPKIATQLVGSFRKRGEGRGKTRDHGRVRRYSGIREPGSVTASVSTKEVHRRRKTARKGMGEAVDINSQQQTQNPQQRQEDPRVKQIQQRDIQTKKRLLQQKMTALQRGATDIDV